MTSVFINPRSLISSSNVDTLLLKSSLAESRLTFINSGSSTGQYQLSPNPFISRRNVLLQQVNQSGTPIYALSSAGPAFSVLQNNVPIAQYQTVSINGVGTVNYSVYGTASASNFAILPGASGRKAVILQDYNPLSLHQFSGIGFQNGVTSYQVPVRNAVHAFYAAASANNSKEWMRLQEDILSGNPQLGIGTTTFTSNVALQVAGNVDIKGNLTVSGGLYGFIDTTSFIKLDSNTGRITSNIMPEKLVFLNPNNKVDDSLLNTGFNFQYLKSQKNVGIGTKNPVQKFQVQGSAYVTERIGIGTAYPSSRIHAVENAAVISAMTLENNAGGDVFNSYISGRPAMMISGTHAGVGIGTTSVPIQTALQVVGNVNVTGAITCCNINLQYVAGNTINITDPVYGPILRLETVIQGDGTTQLALRCSVPFQCYNPLTTDYISSTQSYGTVRIYNSSLSIDNNLFLSSAPIITSDQRLKTDVAKIENALDKLARIRGYTFRYANSGQKSAGVIAQEVKEILPEAVQIVNGGYYGVQYDALIGLIIEAIHELRELH